MKKINKKGFTLVELLAVVVILGVLLLIAVPSVSKVLNSSKESAARDNAIMVAKAVETCIMSEIDGVCDYTADLPAYLEGGIPSGSTVTLVNNKLTGFEIAFKGYTIKVTGSGTIDITKLKNEINTASFSGTVISIDISDVQ